MYKLCKAVLRYWRTDFTKFIHAINAKDTDGTSRHMLSFISTHSHSTMYITVQQENSGKLERVRKG